MGALNDAVDTQRTYIVRTYMAVKRHTSCSERGTIMPPTKDTSYMGAGKGKYTTCTCCTCKHVKHAHVSIA